MKKIAPVFLFFVIFLTSQTFAAELRILNRETKEPVSSATVHCIALSGKYKDSVVVSKPNKLGLLTSPFNTEYRIFISNVGFKSYIDTIAPFTGIKDIFMVQTSVMLDEIVTTGQFVPQSSQKSVYDIKTINQDRIESQGANNLTELLKTESNITISNDAILGSSISINGITGSNVKVLIDGVPVIGRMNGNIDMSQINLNNIQKVEIVEGPMSSVYGSDALGGVINLISKDPFCERLEFDMNSYYESVGTYNFDGSFRYSIDRFNFLVNGGRNLFQGYDRVDSSRSKQWNPKEQYFANVQTIYALKEHNIKLSSRYFDEFILNRGSLRKPYYETAFDDKYYTTRLNNALFLNGKFGAHQFYDVTAAYSVYKRIKNSFFKNLVTLDERMIDAESAQDTSDFTLVNFRATFSDDALTSFLKYQIGGDFNHETAAGQKIKDTKQEITDVAGFLSMQYLPFESLTFQPSVRYIYNSEYEAPVVPALNVRYQFNDNLLFRASYAKGFRAPSLRELYLLFVDINHNIRGNENLKAETSDSYNLSAVFSMNDDKYYFKVEPKFFYNNIYDMITLANIEDDLYQNVNLDNHTTLGGNITLQYMRSNINFKATYGYTGRLNSLYSENPEVNKYNYSPDLSVNFDYKIDYIDTKINLFYKFTGASPFYTIEEVDGVDQTVERSVESYNMFDVSLSKSLFNTFDIVAGATPGGSTVSTGAS